MSVLDLLVPGLAGLPGMVAVVLGGSRARGTHGPDSDWDIGVYYRGTFDARMLAGLGHPGHIAQPGEWGRIVNGGAWLTVDQQPVDVLLRDLDVVEAWWAQAQEGRFDIDNVEGHIAGLPTYTPVGEIAVSRILSGRLPEVDYPEALRRSAAHRWRWCSAFSLFYAEQHLRRGDRTLAVGMMARATVQTAHAVRATRGEWVLNEKRLLNAAGLAGADEILASAWTAPDVALTALRALLDPPRLDEMGAHLGVRG